MILGVQWLTTLSPILWDFEQLILEFKYRGKRQVLRGSHKTTIEWTNGRILQKEVEQNAQLFTMQVQHIELCEV